MVGRTIGSITREVSALFVDDRGTCGASVRFSTDNDGGNAMRVLFGIILGVALTVGLAYQLDRNPEMRIAGTKPMVNWEAVDSNVEAIKTRVHDAWRKTIG